MHVAFSTQWGIDLAELESTPESPACTAYGAYIMDVGMQGASSPTYSSDVLTHDKATRQAFSWHLLHVSWATEKSVCG